MPLCNIYDCVGPLRCPVEQVILRSLGPSVTDVSLAVMERRLSERKGAKGGWMMDDHFPGHSWKSLSRPHVKVKLRFRASSPHVYFE